MALLSAFADEVTDDFIGQLEFLNSENVKFIEIRFVNKKNILDLTSPELCEVKSMLDAHGIGVSAIGSPIGKISLDAPFQQHLDKFNHAMDLALYFGTSLIRIFSYFGPEGKRIDEYRDVVIERMKTKLDRIKNTRIILTIENSPGTYCDSTENCVDVMQALNSPQCRIAYDPGNCIWGNKSRRIHESCWLTMKSYVNHIHVKDWKVDSEHAGSIPGKGDGQIKELFSDLANMRYNGFLTLEPHLKYGGQFGGETGPELFSLAIAATRGLCQEVNLPYEN